MVDHENINENKNDVFDDTASETKSTNIESIMQRKQKLF